MDTLFGLEQANLSVGGAWIAAAAYLMQVYYDFSGYSDMAIGIAGMLGVRLPENFDHPYRKESMTEFWRDWHKSLTDWFRNYLYIPLGGNRKGKIRTYINLMIIFLATGIWHGAGFCYLVWGMWHGIFMVAERMFLRKKLSKIPAFLRHCYVMAVTGIGWVFFRAGSFTRAVRMLMAMFTFRKGTALPLPMFVSTGTWAVFAIAVILLFPTEKLWAKGKTRLGRKAADVLEIGTEILLLLLSVLFLSGGSYSSFIYFQF